MTTSIAVLQEPLTTPIRNHRFVIALRNTETRRDGTRWWWNRRVRTNGDGGVALVGAPLSVNDSTHLTPQQLTLSGVQNSQEEDTIHGLRAYSAALSDAEMDEVLLELCRQWNVPLARPATLTEARWVAAVPASGGGGGSCCWRGPPAGAEYAPTTGDAVMYWTPFDVAVSDDVLQVVGGGTATVSDFTVSPAVGGGGATRLDIRGVALEVIKNWAYPSLNKPAVLRTRYAYGGLDCCVAVSFALTNAARTLGTLVATWPVDVEAFVVTGQNVANSLTFSRIGLDNGLGGSVTDANVAIAADELTVLAFQFEQRADGIYLARSGLRPKRWVWIGGGGRIQRNLRDPTTHHQDPCTEPHRKKACSRSVASTTDRSSPQACATPAELHHHVVAATRKPHGTPEFMG